MGSAQRKTISTGQSPKMSDGIDTVCVGPLSALCCLIVQHHCAAIAPQYDDRKITTLSLLQHLKIHLNIMAVLSKSMAPERLDQVTRSLNNIV